MHLHSAASGATIVGMNIFSRLTQMAMNSQSARTVPLHLSWYGDIQQCHTLGIMICLALMWCHWPNS